MKEGGEESNKGIGRGCYCRNKRKRMKEKEEEGDKGIGKKGNKGKSNNDVLFNGYNGMTSVTLTTYYY